MSRRLLAMLVSAALVVTGLTVTGIVTTTAATASESSMLKQVNAARASAGLGGYRWNSHLADVAGEQAARMAKKAKLYHNPNLASDVGNYRRVGENVGYGPSSSSIQRAFMKSPGHRANILRDYRQIGIAQVRDSTGRLWVAQVFRDPSGSASTTQKRASVKKAAPVKRVATVKRTVAVKRPAAVTKRTAAVPAKATPPSPAATWAVLSSVVGLAQLVAAAGGGLVTPVFQE